MKFILKFKHWVLFLLIAIPRSWSSPSSFNEIVHSISTIIFAIWIYAIGVYGQEKIESLGIQKKNLGFFIFNVVAIPILHFVLFAILPVNVSEEMPVKFDWFLVGSIVVLIYIIFAIFHTVSFACKTLSTIELRREAMFKDYYLTLILFGILLGGIWVLQPKITKLIIDDEAKVELLD
jgi:uncharacterized membrane protein